MVVLSRVFRSHVKTNIVYFYVYNIRLIIILKNFDFILYTMVIIRIYRYHKIYIYIYICISVVSFFFLFFNAHRRSRRKTSRNIIQQKERKAKGNAWNNSQASSAAAFVLRDLCALVSLSLFLFSLSALRDFIFRTFSIRFLIHLLLSFFCR